MAKHKSKGDSAKTHVTLDGLNSTCVVELLGAKITSWKVKDYEQLYMSKKELEEEAPARGGIPLVFPRYGPWGKMNDDKEGPVDGFARTMKWEVGKDVVHKPDDSVEVVLVLRDNEDTRRIWDCAFELTYKVKITDRELMCCVELKNPGPEDLVFNFLFQTHLLVPDVTRCEVAGLRGATFIERDVDGTIANVSRETRDLVPIEGRVARIYQDTPEDVQTVTNTMSEMRIRVTKCNLPDTIVWTPWVEEGRFMDDIELGDITRLLSVQAGYISAPKKIVPGETFQASQILRCLCPVDCH